MSDPPGADDRAGRSSVQRVGRDDGREGATVATDVCHRVDAACLRPAEVRTTKAEEADSPWRRLRSCQDIDEAVLWDHTCGLQSGPWNEVVARHLIARPSVEPFIVPQCP